MLVRVRAAAINDFDWSLVRGKPRLYRLLFGLFKPKAQIPGMELAGTVESLGPGVQNLEIGDEVYGDVSEFGFGALAEYVAVSEEALTRKPAAMSFEEAAAIPHASLLALQGLRDLGQIRRGMRILINGAGGGVGTFGLQIAKAYDAHVTGVDTGDKLRMMESLGFDRVIDYQNEDFATGDDRYDLILDAKTSRWPFAYMRALERGGRYVTVGGYLPRLLVLVILAPLSSLFARRKMQVLALKPNRGIEYMNELFEAGRLECVIDGPYALSEVPRLIRYFGEAKHAGKIIVSLG